MDQVVGSPLFDLHYAVVPTVVIPFAIIGVILSSIVTFIAGLLGVDYEMEGPKKLLLALLKPRFIVFALVLNGVIFGTIYSYKYVSTLPSFMWRIQLKNRNNLPALAEQTFPNTNAMNNIFSSPSNERKFVMGLNLVWEKTIASGSFGGLSKSGNNLYLGTQEGSVLEIDAETGSTRRQFFVGTEVTPVPIVFNNHLYFGEGVHDTHHARFYKFDLLSGKLKSFTQTKGHTEGNGRIINFQGKSYLIFSAGSDGLYAVDPESMNVLWHREIGHTDSEVMNDAEGVLYVSTGIEKGLPGAGQQAFALNVETGATLWQRDLPASGWHAPAIYRDWVCFSGGEIYDFKNRHWGTVACYHKLNGTPTVSFNLDSPLVTYPILVDDDLITVDMAGNLCSLSLLRKERNWCAATQDKSYTYASPIYDGYGNIVFASLTSGLIVFDAKTGEKTYSWFPEDGKGLPWSRPSSIMVIDQGFWYHVDWNGDAIRKFQPEYLIVPKS